MPRSAGVVLAWWMLFACGALVAVGLLLLLGTSDPFAVEAKGGGDPAATAACALFYLACSTVGALIVSHRPRNVLEPAADHHT